MFDPFDLTTVEVRQGGVACGTALPYRIGRHAHPKARPETPPTEPVAPTGINYARLLDATHQAELAQRVNYAAISPTRPDHDQIPGQLDLLTGEETTR